MEKQILVIIKGKEYTVFYKKEGNRIEVTINDEELSKIIFPKSPFFIMNGQVSYLIPNPKIKEIADPIIQHILLHENSN